MIRNQSIEHDTIQNWLVNKIASLTGRPTTEIDTEIPLANYGLDSVHAVGLSGDLEDWLDICVEPTIAWDYPTIKSMANYLEQEMIQYCVHSQQLLNKKVA
jgi:acyl carrier protein